VEAELSKINEILNRVEAQEMQPIIPDNIPLMQLADMVVRGKLSPSQMRLPIELLPTTLPNLPPLPTSLTAASALGRGTYAGLTTIVSFVEARKFFRPTSGSVRVPFRRTQKQELSR